MCLAVVAVARAVHDAFVVVLAVVLAVARAAPGIVAAPFLVALGVSILAPVDPGVRPSAAASLLHSQELYPVYL